MQNYRIYLLLMTFLLVTMLLWLGGERNRDFRHYHHDIADKTVQSVALEISNFIEQKKRLVSLFARDHLGLITELAVSPDDEPLYEELQQKISDYFPDHFAFMITDAAGEPYVEDLDGYIGDVCRNDLQHFIDKQKQYPRIHPNQIAYHFDIVAPYGDGSSSGILFVSFHADVLGKIIKNSQSIGHQTMLIQQTDVDLIEVTAAGARINMPRDDYRLTNEEQSRILHRHDIRGTSWHVIDMHEPGLFDDYIQQRIINSSMILVLFLFVNLMMYLFIRREEALRRQAERYKGEFLSNVSHELRTPITSMRGAIGLLKHDQAGELSGNVHALLDIAANNCERLSLLIDDLLDVQKMEAGKMDFNFDELNLVTLLENSIEMQQGYARKFDVSFKLQTQYQQVMVQADQSRLHQVMANLLSNAAKYGAEHDQILVSLMMEGKLAVVRVEDHGAGIPESFRNRVFARFSQDSDTSSRVPGGTGLGLNIVKLIIEKHQGEVGFESVVGKGTRFYFKLPVLEGYSPG